MLVVRSFSTSFKPPSAVAAGGRPLRGGLGRQQGYRLAIHTDKSNPIGVAALAGVAKWLKSRIVDLTVTRSWMIASWSANE